MGHHYFNTCKIPRLISGTPTSGNTGSSITIDFTGYHLTGCTAVWLATHQGTSLSVTNDGAVTCAMAVPNIAPADYSVQAYFPRRDDGSFFWTFTITA